MAEATEGVIITLKGQQLAQAQAEDVVVFGAVHMLSIFQTRETQAVMALLQAPIKEAVGAVVLAVLAGLVLVLQVVLEVLVFNPTYLQRVVSSMAAEAPAADILLQRRAA